MNLNQFTQMDINDSQGWQQFLTANDIAHQTIAARIEARGLTVNRIPLMEDPHHNVDWILDHDQLHKAEAFLLNISIPTLDDLNLKDPEQFYYWMLAHGAIHAAENSILGIY